MKILVTGAAGFIGSFVAKALLLQGHEVIGLDNLSSYYSVKLKKDRLADVGIYQDEASHSGEFVSSVSYLNYRFIKLDLIEQEKLMDLFRSERFDFVIHLAAQAGVRYSLENPRAYIDSNITGSLNILESCRYHPVQHLIMASSSSVYGKRIEMPYRETACTDEPVSLYAATKKSDELMAYTYSQLYKLPITIVRPFTVYGPWGRLDMAPFIFTQAILEEKPIQVFNHGNLLRDFTYIDDVVECLLRILNFIPDKNNLFHIYNIGRSSPVKLLTFISIIEEITGKKAIKQMLDMQPGDVYCTCADTSRLEHDIGYVPHTTLQEGIRCFYNWYKSYIIKE